VSDHQEETEQFPNTAYDLIVLGSSAGGLKALIAILSVLPTSFPAALAIVQHMSPNYPSQIAEILRHRIQLTTKQVQNGDLIRPSTAYIAPPDFHLLVTEGGKLLLSHSAAVQYVRPSANLLFESAANIYKDRVIAVVLTGTGSDGAAGTRAIKDVGGKVIAQDEATSEFFGMPGAAIETGTVDFILPLKEIAGTLLGLVIPKET